MTSKISIIALILIVAMYIAGVIGWGMNIYKFLGTDFKCPCKAEIVRGVGIALVPFGSIMGYMDIDDN